MKELLKRGEKVGKIVEAFGPPVVAQDVYQLKSDMRKSGELPPVEHGEKKEKEKDESNEAMKDVPIWLRHLLNEQETLRKKLKVIDEVIDQYADEFPLPKSLKR